MAYIQTFHSQAENVIPSTAVQAGRVLFEFVQELLHLESSRQSLDEARRSDTVLGETQFAGCEVEDIVPKSSLEVVFHLREVEVRAVASLDEFRGVVEEVNGKVEKTAGDGLSIDEDVAFVKVPSSWAEGVSNVSHFICQWSCGLAFGRKVQLTGR